MTLNDFTSRTALLDTDEVVTKRGSDAGAESRQTVAVVRRDLLSPAAGTFRLKVENDGTMHLQLKNRTTGLWHTVGVDGSSGAEVLTIGVAES